MSNTTRRVWGVAIVCSAALSPFPSMAFSQAQAPAPASASSGAAAQAPAPVPAKPGESKPSHADDFLIRGTVFNEKALSFPGVRVRIRRAGEKKFRWETYTNSRGEFAIRLPQRADYEIVVRVKGFIEQSRAVSAKTGENYESLAFRLEPDSGGKK